MTNYAVIFWLLDEDIYISYNCKIDVAKLTNIIFVYDGVMFNGVLLDKSRYAQIS